MKYTRFRMLAACASGFMLGTLFLSAIRWNGITESARKSDAVTVIVSAVVVIVVTVLERAARKRNG